MKIKMEIKNTMEWLTKKENKTVGQPVLTVDAEPEPMASHIIFTR